MPTCSSFTCSSVCKGYWSGCYSYSCINVAPVTPRGSWITITDDDGFCLHLATRINDYSGAWSDYGSSLRNYYEYTTSRADEGFIAYAQHIKDLRDAINEERRRRYLSGASQYSGLSKKTWTADITTNINAGVIDELRDAINEIQSGSVGVDPSTGEVAESYPDVDRIRYKIEQYRKSCVCDTDCGSNSQCSCYCDCGCNYSDMRLKEDIRSL